ncbi:histidinol-phosphate transaminase [Chakrabartyella piscis]|uniref:pyridoxal phosphate-dependent aminotransferase n=1 Tax=Chakrabartyella piscis TaxID=2918914 RepID=UPI00295867DB|nr:histidinol-phosphate transaminase [Chakrabartyella piscis]
MSNTQETLHHAHGGDLDAIQRKYQIPKEEIKDFSGNINPLGFPKSAELALANNLHLISTYPDKQYTALREAISTYTNANKDHIVVGNGSTELISTFIQTVAAKNSIVLGPAYSEYEREITLLGGGFAYFPLEEKNDFQLDIDHLIASLTKEIGMLVICNPNNPTGTAISTMDLERILTHCKAIGASVLVDETYIEFADNINEICAIPLVESFDNLFVIRGTSKFFAAPGIRLGYGVSSNKEFLHHLQSNQDPWSVNSLAAFVGEHIFSDFDFHKETQTLVSTERQKALDILSTWNNIKAYPSSANFILLKLLTDKTTSAAIFEHLIQKKLLIRNAASFTFLDETYLRFCILAPEDNANLLMALKEIVE